MAKIIALTNQKGGVGKTTTCCAICGGLAQMGKKVLAIDLDPQGNLSFSLGIDDEDAYTIYDVFKGNCDISDAVQKGGICDVIASNILLSGVELELTGVGREYILREQLKTIREELGEENTADDIDEFKKQLKELDASDEVKEKISKEISRFKGMAASAAEATVQRGYLETDLRV